jgi:hypothetical protein
LIAGVVPQRLLFDEWQDLISPRPVLVGPDSGYAVGKASGPLDAIA